MTSHIDAHDLIEGVLVRCRLCGMRSVVVPEFTSPRTDTVEQCREEFAAKHPCVLSN